MTHRGAAVISADLIIQGELRSGGDIDVLGFVTGSISAAKLTVHEGGKVHGSVRAESAQINGLLQGTIAVRNLIDIGATGSVSGDVRYGRLAMAPGAELSADMLNVPPEIGGDLNLAVRRGRSVRVTTEDLQAIDPDSGAETLIFTVTRPTGGWVVRAAEPATPIDTFSQSDLAEGTIYFVHDGGTAPQASIDVAVSDQAGASSGSPKTLRVAVITA